jgi:hypothetical protein
MATDSRALPGEPDFDESAHHSRADLILGDPAAWAEHQATQAQLEAELNAAAGVAAADPTEENLEVHLRASDALTRHRSRVRKVGGMAITAEVNP